jgi:hypothetical protein
MSFITIVLSSQRPTTCGYLRSRIRELHVSSTIVNPSKSCLRANYVAINLQPTIKIIRQGVVQESTLLQIRETDGLSRPVEILRRTTAVTNRKPWARLLNTLCSLRKTSVSTIVHKTRKTRPKQVVKLTFKYPRTCKYLIDGFGFPDLVKAAK